MTPDAILYITMVLCIIAAAVSTQVALVFWLGYKNYGNPYIERLAFYLSTAPIAMLLVLGLLFTSNVYTRKDFSCLVIGIISIYVIITGVTFLFSSVDKKYCGEQKV